MVDTCQPKSRTRWEIRPDVRGEQTSRQMKKPLLCKYIFMLMLCVHFGGLLADMRSTTGGVLVNILCIRELFLLSHSLWKEGVVIVEHVMILPFQHFNILTHNCYGKELYPSSSL